MRFRVELGDGFEDLLLDLPGVPPMGSRVELRPAHDPNSPEAVLLIVRQVRWPEGYQEPVLVVDEYWQTDVSPS